MKLLIMMTTRKRSQQLKNRLALSVVFKLMRMKMKKMIQQSKRRLTKSLRMQS